MFDKVIGGFANPGPDFLYGVARAFGVSRREAFARAGLIEPEPPITNMVKEMQAEYAALSEEDQKAILKQVKALHDSYTSDSDPQRDPAPS